MIQSANDGCIALAEGIAGNETEFVRMMNERAREIGLTKSYFTNVDGLPDPKMRVTPRELGQWRATSFSIIPITTNGLASAIHLEQDSPAERNPLIGTVDGARRHEDRIHQRGRLQPRRFRGAERRAADRRRHRIEECQGSRRRRQEASRLRVQEFRCPHSVRRGSERGRGQGLWRRTGAASPSPQRTQSG